MINHDYSSVTPNLSATGIQRKGREEKRRKGTNFLYQLVSCFHQFGLLVWFRSRCWLWTTAGSAVPRRMAPPGPCVWLFLSHPPERQLIDISKHCVCCCTIIIVQHTPEPQGWQTTGLDRGGERQRARSSNSPHLDAHTSPTQVLSWQLDDFCLH